MGHHTIRIYLSLVTFFLTLLFSLSGMAYAADLTLSWDRPDDHRVSGYKVFYGESGTDFLSEPMEIIDSPDATRLVIHDLSEGQHIGFSLKSMDSLGNESDFSEMLYHLVASDGDNPEDAIPEDIIIDNGDPGASWDGLWRLSAGKPAYGHTSVYNIDPGGAYTFEAELTGYHDVSLWWTYYPTRCYRVDVDIYDGDYLVASLIVNQRFNGGRWNSLGEYEFNGTARVVIHSSGHCSTNADSVRFMNRPFSGEGM